jgi:hypothetical protein
VLVTISAAAARVMQRTPSLLGRLRLATTTAIRQGRLIGGRWQFQLAAPEAIQLRMALNVEADARRSAHDTATAQLLDGAAADITAAMIANRT